ncbi:redoxin domain-containing protein [Natrinema longum]|uniref:thioredoxin-dependent peroxiredoxin n=1 Tax=Natrinema longum TaxID=370324 RepID=A0A8A2U6I2_9EURY|nr:redoxin domain-containing protein [Natrinema longum]MBZ6494664.1 redoxin domain-containing protein [Natrinema longum]QSW84022.1 redoxin domain-containing protein [Natrinema longum]
MLETGATAPTFDGPAAIDGEVRQVTFEELIGGSGVTVLLFYPADFSPSCTEELCSLRDFDLVGLQNDVSIVGVSTDTAFTHREFADRHDLGFPLVSDGDGSIAASYGVLEDELFGGHRQLARRTVFVLDEQRTVHYVWSNEDPLRQPDLEAIRAAIEGISDDDAAVERYRVATTHYREGSEEYERARDAFAGEDWVTAADAFDAAVEPLTAALEAFDAARRYADDDAVARAAERANERATDRRNAAKWYAMAADHYARGDETAAEEPRADADRAHARATDGEDLPAPDDLTDGRDVPEQ